MPRAAEREPGPADGDRERLRRENEALASELRKVRSQRERYRERSHRLQSVLEDELASEQSSRPRTALERAQQTADSRRAAELQKEVDRLSLALEKYKGRLREEEERSGVLEGQLQTAVSRASIASDNVFARASLGIPAAGFYSMAASSSALAREPSWAFPSAPCPRLSSQLPAGPSGPSGVSGGSGASGGSEPFGNSGPPGLPAFPGPSRPGGAAGLAGLVPLATQQSGPDVDAAMSSSSFSGPALRVPTAQASTVKLPERDARETREPRDPRDQRDTPLRREAARPWENRQPAKPPPSPERDPALGDAVEDGSAGRAVPRVRSGSAGMAGPAGRSGSADASSPTGALASAPASRSARSARRRSQAEGLGEQWQDAFPAFPDPAAPAPEGYSSQCQHCPQRSQYPESAPRIPRISGAVAIGEDDNVLSLRDRLETAYDTISQLLDYLSHTKAQPGELRRLCAAFRARNILPMYIQHRKTEFALKFDASNVLVEGRALRGTFVPERALRYAYIFGKRENIPREIMNDLLLALGAAFKQQEQELRMQEVGELNDAVLDLKRRLAQKVPYNIVRAEEEIRHLRSELWRYRELYHRCKARVPKAIRVNFSEGGFSVAGNSSAWLSAGGRSGQLSRRAVSASGVVAGSLGGMDEVSGAGGSHRPRRLGGRFSADHQTIGIEDMDSWQHQVEILEELRGLRGELQVVAQRARATSTSAEPAVSVPLAEAATTAALATSAASAGSAGSPGSAADSVAGFDGRGREGDPGSERDGRGRPYRGSHHRSRSEGADATMAHPPTEFASTYQPERGSSPFRAGFLAGQGGVPPPGTEEYLPFMAGCTHVARLMTQDIESLFDKISTVCAGLEGGEEVMTLVRRYSAKFRALLCSVMESLTSVP